MANIDKLVSFVERKRYLPSLSSVFKLRKGSSLNCSVSGDKQQVIVFPEIRNRQHCRYALILFKVYEIYDIASFCVLSGLRHPVHLHDMDLALVGKQHQEIVALCCKNSFGKIGFLGFYTADASASPSLGRIFVRSQPLYIAFVCHGDYRGMPLDEVFKKNLVFAFGKLCAALVAIALLYIKKVGFYYFLYL